MADLSELPNFFKNMGAPESRTRKSLQKSSFILCFVLFKWFSYSSWPSLLDTSSWCRLEIAVLLYLLCQKLFECCSQCGCLDRASSMREIPSTAEQQWDIKSKTNPWHAVARLHFFFHATYRWCMVISMPGHGDVPAYTSWIVLILTLWFWCSLCICIQRGEIFVRIAVALRIVSVYGCSMKKRAIIIAILGSNPFKKNKSGFSSTFSGIA